MAGRGTDIKLTDEVIKLGGLAIIGTERHDSRRVDNQLRGRSGRQGDPGESRFYVSMDDDLMRLFGSNRIKAMMERLGLPDEMPIENIMISRSIESAQKRVEGHNFDIRKHLLEYDDVMNKHREIIYSRRLKILQSDDLKEDILEMMSDEAKNVVIFHTSTPNRSDWDLTAVVDSINAILPHQTKDLDVGDIEKLDKTDDIIDNITNILHEEYRLKEESLPDPKFLRDVEKRVYLHVIDALWMEHIDQMTQLRESVSLRGYGQRDPLMEYKQEAFQALKKLLDSIQHNTVNTIFKVQINIEAPPEAQDKSPAPQQMQTNKDAIEGNISGTKFRRQPASAEAAVAQRISADSPSAEKVAEVGRNKPCPCGSGKKYKNGHGK